MEVSRLLRSLPAYPTTPNIGLLAELIYKEHTAKACDKMSSDNTDAIYMLIHIANQAQAQEFRSFEDSSLVVMLLHSIVSSYT